MNNLVELSNLTVIYVNTMSVLSTRLIRVEFKSKSYVRIYGHASQNSSRMSSKMVFGK